MIEADGLKDRHLVINKVTKPNSIARKVTTGVQMLDDGHITFTQEEQTEFLKKEPNAKKWFRKYYGGDEFINGEYRWILYLKDIPPNELRNLPLVKERVSRVAAFRNASSRPATNSLPPTLIGVDNRLGEKYLVVPNTSSERRDYIPIGWLTPNVIANQKLRILPNPTKWEFAILTSAMHMAWMRTVTGRLESRYMYSVGVVYNTFPWPNLTDKAKAILTKTGQAILDARAEWPQASLADLYDPDAMPANLRKAHIANDKAVDKLYRTKKFDSERERVEHLFMLYEELTAPMLAASVPKKRRARARKVK